MSQQRFYIGPYPLGVTPRSAWMYNWTARYGQDPRHYSPTPTVNCIQNSQETVSQMILNTIIANNGIGSNIYGLTGSGIYQNDLVWQTAVNDGSINYIPVTLESYGALMAQYEAYINGLNGSGPQVGIITYTCGPGDLVPLAQLYNSLFEYTPCIAITGKSTENFDFVDQSIFSAIFKKVYIWDSTSVDINVQMQDAFNIALNGTTENPGPGPVYIQVSEPFWLSTYKYTQNNPPSCIPPAPYSPTVRNFTPFINKIMNTIVNNRSSRILIRIGNQVSKTTAQTLANLTLKYSNLFVLLVWNNNNPVNLSQYPNVAREGQLGSTPANYTYKRADIFIEVGLGITARFFNQLNVTCYLPVNTPQYFMFDYVLPFMPTAANKYNTIIGYSSDIFMNQLVSTFDNYFTNYPPVSGWPNISGDINLFLTNGLTNLANQTVTTDASYLTVVAHMANLFQTMYDMSGNSSNPLLLNTTSKNLFVGLDVGLSSFLADMYCYVDSPAYKIALNDYSPIGDGPAVLAGVLRSTLPVEYAVQIIGDGGQLSTLGSLVDLTIAMKALSQANKKIKVLYFLAIDNNYSNVSNQELALFGTTTSMTQTSGMLSQINFPNIIQSLMSDLLIQTLEIPYTTEPSTELTTFVQNWYTDADGFTDNGFYLVLANSPKYSLWDFAQYPPCPAV